jgi:hypothetical protein
VDQTQLQKEATGGEDTPCRAADLGRQTSMARARAQLLGARAIQSVRSEGKNSSVPTSRYKREVLSQIQITCCGHSNLCYSVLDPKPSSSAERSAADGSGCGSSGGGGAGRGLVVPLQWHMPETSQKGLRPPALGGGCCGVGGGASGMTKASP